MANPDIPAALVVLQAHLTAAGAALTTPIRDVDRGLPVARGRAIRYYWGGETQPPGMGQDRRVLNGEMVGHRFFVVALLPLSDMSEQLVTAVDTEAQLLAADIRTRINGDATLGGNVTDLDLDYGETDFVVIANTRFMVIQWTLDLAYTEHAIAP